MKFLYLIVTAVIFSSGLIFYSNGQASDSKAFTHEAEKAVYVCPMHPEVRSDKPGKCPICKMNLEKQADSHSSHSQH